jgi:hypothetical protein
MRLSFSTLRIPSRMGSATLSAYGPIAAKPSSGAGGVSQLVERDAWPVRPSSAARVRDDVILHGARLSHNSALDL